MSSCGAQYSVRPEDAGRVKDLKDAVVQRIHPSGQIWPHGNERHTALECQFSETWRFSGSDTVFHARFFMLSRKSTLTRKVVFEFVTPRESGGPGEPLRH